MPMTDTTRKRETSSAWRTEAVRAKPQFGSSQTSQSYRLPNRLNQQRALSVADITRARSDPATRYFLSRFRSRAFPKRGAADCTGLLEQRT